VAYRLDLPKQMKHFPVFHVSLLAPWHETGPIRPPPWHLLGEDGSAMAERILNHRDSTRGSKTVKEYLVQWSGAAEADASWVPELRVPHSLSSAYWLSKAPSPNSYEAMDPPLARSLRRSRRQRGMPPAGAALNHMMVHSEAHNETWDPQRCLRVLAPLLGQKRAPEPDERAHKNLLTLLIIT
jgi:hypothetical protein